MKGPASAISIAENQVILKTVKRESPDFASPATQKELLGDVALLDLAAEDSSDNVKEITISLGMRAVYGSKKDVMNVVSAAAMVGLTVTKLVTGLKSHEDGAGWIIFETSAWVSVDRSQSFEHELI